MPLENVHISRSTWKKCSFSGACARVKKGLIKRSIICNVCKIVWVMHFMNAIHQLVNRWFLRYTLSYKRCRQVLACGSKCAETHTTYPSKTFAQTANHFLDWKQWLSKYFDNRIPHLSPEAVLHLLLKLWLSMLAIKLTEIATWMDCAVSRCMLDLNFTWFHWVNCPCSRLSMHVWS